MSLDVWMDGGALMPTARTWRQRLLLRWGRYLAVRHAGVAADPSCLLHPQARIDPRDGRIAIGARTSVAAGAAVQGSVRLGADCSVQAYSLLVGYGEAGTITIGDGVRIAAHCMLIAADHVFADPDRPIHGQGLRPAPITVGEGAWIAGRCLVTAGVAIGRGAVIGAGAVVTRDIPDLAIAVGVPARVVGRRGG